MPIRSFDHIWRMATCPYCGATAGAVCVTDTGNRMVSYTHAGRIERSLIDRKFNGQKLIDYPLAKRYEWEYFPTDYRRPRWQRKKDQR
jgi:hypothetical protein